MAAVLSAFGQSEPSTYFNVFVPPNNDAVKRNVALVITALSDSTHFTITDDSLDGDSDDNVKGMLHAGQSYILYIKDNGINDDALYASGGKLTRDGDYFIIQSDKLVFASMTTDSDWEHDFLPSVNKKTVGQKFYAYAAKVTSSPRDLNVFAYEDSTSVSVYRISGTQTSQTGYTNIDQVNKKLVFNRTLNLGQDIIHLFTDGRDIMETGHTYLIEANKNISVQHGALWGNARDGGAYVPSSNGSGSGELFYFAVPYQQNGEQEIRIVSWDKSNKVELSRYDKGKWTAMKSWTLNELEPADWVGAQDRNATFPTVFRVSCSSGKRVSVMEANWMETGSTTTSDMSTMLSSESGSSSGKRFLAYMLPPGLQNNVVNPFTGKTFGGSMSHFYLFAGNKKTTVTVKDAKTNGKTLSRTYQIDSGRYADAAFSISDWQSIYNGNGRPTGSDRPYVIIEATEHIAVLSTNFNDNWLNHFGSSLPTNISQKTSLSSPVAIPGDSVTLTTQILTDTGKTIKNACLEVKIASGLIPLESKLICSGKTKEIGNIQTSPDGSKVRFDSIPSIQTKDKYEIETKVIVSSTDNRGRPIPNETVLSLETVVSGTVDNEFQQSYITRGVKNNSANTSKLLYDACQLGNQKPANNDSWNPSWADYDGDGDEDLFIPTKSVKEKNELYRNNGNGTFTKILSHPLVNEMTQNVAAVWADVDNDGRLDVFLVNTALHRSKLFSNEGKGEFSENTKSGIEPHPQYFHGAAFADFDNDGFSDLVITNFFQTHFHKLYRNNGDNTFSAVTNTPVTMESERAMAPILSDYNNDGLVDIFIPNGNDRPNSLFRNLGNFQFEKVRDSVLDADAKNSVGAAWGDYNNDGFQDLLVLNASGQNEDLYRNLGNGSFEKVDSSLIAIQGGDSHGAAWMDANNDGWLDLVITNDQGFSHLYLNNKKGGFARQQLELVSGNLGKAFGVAVGDPDKDGNLDLAVSTHTDGDTRLFCHNGNSGRNWIGFQLQGTASNKQALGARIAIYANGSWQYRQHLPVSGFGSQNTQLVHFGLESAKKVDSVVVFWPSGFVQQVGKFKTGCYNPVLEEDGKIVTGMVYHDTNNNSRHDSGEAKLSNIRLAFNQGSINLASDDSGAFRFRTGEEVITLALLQSHWKVDASMSKHSFDPKSDSLHLEIPLQAVNPGYDLSIAYINTPWRRGFENESVLRVENLGTEDAKKVFIELHMPKETYVNGASMKYDNPSGKEFRWEIGTLKAGEVVQILVADSTGLKAKIGQLLTVSAFAYASGKDLDPMNDSMAAEVEIVGAIDPNDILVSPRGDGPLGYIHKEQWLTYTIRFENIGTYKATYVFLNNQLPAGLDPASFEVVSSSHPYTYQIAENGLLRVSYRNIDLPAAVDDSVGAHGYFMYKIKPRETISGGTQIANLATIQFDFEEPITTNTVINTIKKTGSNEVQNLKLFPNPSGEWVYAVVDEAYYTVTAPRTIAWWTVLTTNGESILEGRGNAEPIVRIDLSSLSAGNYIVRVADDTGKTYAGRLIKR